MFTENPTSPTVADPETPSTATPSQTEGAGTSQTPPPVAPPQPTSTIPSDERMLAAVGYIPMLFVGPLIMKPHSKFCQMHGKQAMITTVLSFFTLFMLALIPAIGSLLFLGMIGVVTLGMYQAYSGVEWKMPIVHDIAMKVDVDSLFAGTSVKPTTTPSGTAPMPQTPTAPSPASASVTPPTQPTESTPSQPETNPAKSDEPTPQAPPTQTTEFTPSQPETNPAKPEPTPQTPPSQTPPASSNPNPQT